MKKIKIFIGSSVDKREFEIEREKLGSFVNGLNRTLVDKGVFVDLYDCETVSPKMHENGSQEQHDDYIANDADVTYFLFFKKAGPFTMHELQVAHDTLVKCKRPDVFTYFKVVGEDIEQTEEIKKAVDLIANSYGHYFSKFSDVDTVKLGMLQYIAEKLENDSAVSVSDGQFLLNGIEVKGLEIENVFAYRNNAEYKALTQKKQALEEKIKIAVDKKDYAAIGAPAAEKERVDKQLAQLEQDIFKMLLDMHKQLQKEHPDPLLMRAYRLLELGRYREALQLVPLTSLEEQDAANQMQAELEQQKYQSVVEMAKVRISALEMDVDNPDRFAMMESTYDAVLESAFLAREYIFINEYLQFLLQHGLFEKSNQLAERLQGFWTGLCMNDLSLWVNSYLIRSMIFKKMQDADNEGEMLQKALKLCMTASWEPKQRNAHLCAIYNGFGIYHKNKHDYNNAMICYKNAIHHIQDAPPYTAAAVYKNMGILTHIVSGAQAAEPFFLKAEEYFLKEYKKSPNAYYYDLASLEKSLGALYSEIGEIQLALRYINRSEELLKQFWKKNTQLNLSMPVTVYIVKARIYIHTGDTAQAIDYYHKAGQALKDTGNERYYFRLADIYFQIYLQNHSMKYKRKAIKIAKQYPDNLVCRKILEELKY